MSGTVALQWESHMAEVMWRSDVKSNVYSFFDFLKTVYTLDKPPHYTYTSPMFDSWTGPFEKDGLLQPAFSDNNTETESEAEQTAPLPVARKDVTQAPATSPPEDEADDSDKTLVEPPKTESDSDTEEKRPNKTDNVCHPIGYEKNKIEKKVPKSAGRKKSFKFKKPKVSTSFLKPTNWEWSDDEDFVKPNK